MAPYDIILLSAHRDHFGSVAQDISIGVNLLSVYLREKGRRPALFRGFAHQAWPWLERAMQQSGARSVGFYCDYENQSLVAGMSRRVKERWGVPVIVGGPQAIGLDREFFARSGCDVAVRGEGELALEELLAHFLEGRGSLEEMEGLTYPDEKGELRHTPDRRPMADLDALPWPDYRQEPGSDQWNVLPVLTGRGCPFRCAFCYEGGNSRRVRFRGVADVIKEIEAQFDRHPGFKYVFFIDDTFTLNPGRVEAFCREMTRLRRERDFVWFCEGHVQTLHKHPEMLSMMAGAGLVKLFLGIESGSNRVLSLYRKKTTAGMIAGVLEKCVEADIPQVTGNIIVGGPVEGPETLAADAELIDRLLHIAPGRFDSLGFFLIPYPNTAITRDPERFGIKLSLGRQAQSMEDIPLSESEALDWGGMYNARQKLNRGIMRTMHRLFLEGRIPHQVVLANYRLALRYGVYSRWLSNVWAQHPRLHRYYELLARDGLRRSEDIEPGGLRSWRPLRVFQHWSSVSREGGYPSLDGVPLSPLENQLLLMCSGKLRLEEILDRAHGEFGRAYGSRDEFDQTAVRLLKNFEDRRWMAYSRH